jgi:antirestriction protein ArdC
LRRPPHYKQAAELGGQSRKSDKGSLVVYADTFTKTGTDDQGADVDIEIPPDALCRYVWRGNLRPK